ncbi:Alpha-N-acetylglucosaminidase [Escovopsis weberi]|uniref:Alpha-N-acetylglucosaminidase n=1 Tax=Escovopsis weberi TaxID=150374 RepID=A0A0M8N602_ESCWE|nr:Alpha-N-acetylglucosaminidase [Escovopsis weberi]
MRLLSAVAWAVSVVHVAAAAASRQPSTAGIEALLKRRLPDHADAFELSLVEPCSQDSNKTVESYYVQNGKDGKIVVEGSTISAILSGAFWSWEDWELELDWMALRGINLPLAWIGVEQIFIEVFREVGFTDAEISSFLSGPAFQAWNHFGNIQGSWGGDLPFAWVEDQFALQKKIVARMGELGMTPILPAFTGYVPRNISRVRPDARVSNGSSWEGFPAENTFDTFLDPFDPMFAELQKSFIDKQKQAYGDITNFYTLDQFNENNPASGDLDYLHNVSTNTWKSLKAADPDAVWFMQGWLFVSNGEFWTDERIKSFLDGIPNNDDMMILDLASESTPQWQRTQSYHGKPWIWCEIHGYGGNMGLYGQILNVTVDPVEALGESKSLVGFGLSMEGQEGNEIMYDLLLDQAWSSDPIETKAWFHKWVTARYSGGSLGRGRHGEAVPLPEEVYAAWEALRLTVFNNANLTANAVPKSIMELVPSTSGLTDRVGHHPTKLSYDPAAMVGAWKHLFQAGIRDPALYLNPSFQFDLVDFTRQVMANAFIPAYQKLVKIYTTPNKNAQNQAKQLKAQGQELIELMKGLDLVLSTNENFRLDTWIKAARKSAGGDAEMADFMEYEARNQVTLWGPSGQISDYASKSWSGLVLTYYVPRWTMFVNYLVATAPSAYNQTAFNAELLKWELGWVNEKTGDSNECGDELPSIEKVLPVILRKWAHLFA